MKHLVLIIAAFVILTSADKAKPKILIIGDSISNGYTPFVKEALKDNALVDHNPGNAQYSGTGVAMIDEWLGNEKWDVVQFNFGLWDLYGWENADILRTPETYARNLEKIVVRLKKTGAKLIWVTTTPVCPGPEVKCKLIIDSDTESAFQNAALGVMEKYKVKVNNINKVSRKIYKNHGVGYNDVHFTTEGYKLLAQEITKELKKILKTL